jgi:hypothetical protein
MSEVTRILSALEEDDPHAAEQVLPLAHDELHRLASRWLETCALRDSLLRLLIR